MVQIKVHCTPIDLKLHKLVLEGSGIHWSESFIDDKAIITITAEDPMTLYYLGSRYAETKLRYSGQLGDFLRGWKGYELYAAKTAKLDVIKVVDVNGDVVHTVPFTTQNPGNINRAIEKAKTWVNEKLLKAESV